MIGGGAFGVDVLGAADGGDLAVVRHDRVGVEDRFLHGAGEHQPDIADHQLGGAACLGFIVGHRFIPFRSMPSRSRAAILRAA